MKMLSTSSKVVFMNCIIACKRRTCEEANDIHRIFHHFLPNSIAFEKKKIVSTEDIYGHVYETCVCIVVKCRVLTRWFSLCINYYHYLQPRPQLLCNRFSLLLFPRPDVVQYWQQGHTSIICIQLNLLCEVSTWYSRKPLRCIGKDTYFILYDVCVFRLHSRHRAYARRWII